MKRLLVLAVLLSAVSVFGSAASVATQEDAADTAANALYCVAEGNLPETPTDCVVVERIEDVPSGAVWLPAHGGLTDPDAIRRFWSRQGTGDPATEVAAAEEPTPSQAVVSMSSGLVGVASSPGVTTLKLLNRTSMSLHS